MQSLSTDHNNRLKKWLLLSLLFAILFISLGLTVKYTLFFDALNQATTTWLIHHHTPITDIFFISITILCEPPYYYVLAAALLVWLTMNRQPLLTLHFFITFSVIYYISPFLKMIFEIVRPDAGMMHTSYAFPSGHTLIACVALGFWSLIFTQHLAGRKKYWLMLVYNIPAILVGFSRLYLAVHWVTDVVGGFLIGWAINSLSFSIHKPQRSIKPDKCFFIIMSVALLIIVYLINLHLDEKLRFYEQITHALQ
jgi:undecaprenyl-diphosphatase